jgi:hypothetical protein
MNKFYFIIYSLLLLLISACFSKPNGSIKHVPSYSRVNSAQVIQARAKIRELEAQVNKLWNYKAYNSKGQETGQTLRAQLGENCQAATGNNKRYCKEIQKLNSQIKTYQKIVSSANQNIVTVSNKAIFPILSPNDKAISKYYSFLNQKKNSDSQLVELGVELVSVCDGIAANMSPSVLDFLTCPVAKILLQPDRVESYKVKPKPNLNIPEQERLGPFPIEINGQGRNLEGENLRKFQALLLTENSYVFGKEKRCRFRPEMGLHFIKGNEAVEVLFSVPCRLWLFVYRDVKKLEDFDRILDKMAFLNFLFTD